MDDEAGEALHPSESTRPEKPLYIAGLGASAGGLEALHRLFARVHRTGNLAYVVVQHLSPDFRSMMDELLARCTELPIRQAEHNIQVEPDTVYLLPPRKAMTISGDRLQLSERELGHGPSFPIDSFFRSLAEELGPRAVGVVLSGTGSDGSRGIRAIHDYGGLVLVQNEATAKFEGMPRSAIDTGLADAILSPEDIAEAMAKFAGAIPMAPPSTEESDPLKRIFGLLIKTSGVDFAGYKETTVHRRIERRVLLTDSRDVSAYADKLASDPAEVGALCRDLLIGVTRFFRDTEAFERLRREMLPEMVTALGDNDELRIWSAGCATGEEAYALGMMAFETFRQQTRSPSFKVFATDIHPAAIETAGRGIYTEEAVAHVPTELKERYFTRVNGEYRVVSELRSRMVFAQHNLLREAPFTRLHLLVCRNLLIYLQATEQRRALHLFHFALRPRGVLFLGPSETPGPLSDEFVALDTRWQIFRKRREVALPMDVRLGSPELGSRMARTRTSEAEARVEHARTELLARYAPPSLLVTAEGTLLHAFNGGGKFLIHRDGQPSLSALDLLPGELRYTVAGALRRAEHAPGAVEYGGLTVHLGEDTRHVSVTVLPLERSPERTETYLISMIESTPDLLPDVPSQEEAPLKALAEERISALENELRRARESLQATVEEMEASNEELQATNEELVASNEELQSTNEELHSVNEELYTVNAEYQAKIAELTELSADMNHLFESTEVHTLFLDSDLRLRRFTPRMAEVFNLEAQDVGRRIEAFAHSLDAPELSTHLHEVLATGERFEQEVGDKRGRHFLLRILPYRAKSEIAGVVVTLVDISGLREAKDQLERSEERYRSLVRAVTSVLWTTDASGGFVVPQIEWQQYTGQSWEEHRGEGWANALHPDDREAVKQIWQKALEARAIYESQGRIWSAAHKEYRYFVARAAPLFDEHGEVREWVGHVVDVHDSKIAELELRKKDEQLKAILEHSPAFIFIKDAAGRYMLAGRQCSRLFGISADEIVGKTDLDILPAENARAMRESDLRVLKSGEQVEVEETIPSERDCRTLLTIKFPLLDELGQVYAVAGVAADVTEIKRSAEHDRQALEARDRFLAMLSHELRTPLYAIITASEILEREDLSENQSLAARTVITRQAQHMGRMLADLLDVARLTRGTLSVSRERIDLSVVLREAVAVIRPMCEAKKIDLEAELPELPIWVIGDSSRLQQVFTNVLSNAVKFTDVGKVRLSVIVEGDFVLTHVDDTGRGMTQDEIVHAFDLFFQAPQALDRKLGGLGVGLSLARTIVQMLGGQIWIESEGEGHGTCVTLRLPCAPLAEMPKSALPGSQDGKRKKIAIVEDSAAGRDMLRLILELEGHTVFTAGNGDAGFSLIMNERPDVAFIDIGIPPPNGYELAQRLRAAGAKTRLVALTGYGRNEDRLEAFRAGFDEHLVKPAQVAQLKAVINNLSGKVLA